MWMYPSGGRDQPSLQWCLELVLGLELEKGELRAQESDQESDQEMDQGLELEKELALE